MATKHFYTSIESVSKSHPISVGQTREDIKKPFPLDPICPFAKRTKGQSRSCYWIQLVRTVSANVDNRFMNEDTFHKVLYYYVFCHIQHNIVDTRWAPNVTIMDDIAQSSVVMVSQITYLYQSLALFNYFSECEWML